jgi:hypothetical protein
MVDIFAMEFVNSPYGNGKRNRERRSISSKYENKSALASYYVVSIIVSVTYSFSFYWCNSFIRCLQRRLHGITSQVIELFVNNAVRTTNLPYA